jgi:hypothetical protein
VAATKEKHSDVDLKKRESLLYMKFASKAISGWLLHAHEDVPKDFSVLRSKHMGDVREYYYSHIKLHQLVYDYLDYLPD